VILSLREDYLFYLLECDRLEILEVTDNDILNKEKFRYYLDNFSQNQAKKVFQELAKLSSFYIEEALIERLVSDLAEDFGKVRPIELQVVGVQLQAEKISKLSEYKSTKDLIEQFLETILQDCGPENELIAHSILYSLTDEKLTRPIINQNELELLLITNLSFSKSENLKNEQVNLVLDILVKSGLVFVLPGLPKRYQLIHDYFVTFIRESILANNRKRLDQLNYIEEAKKIIEEQIYEKRKEFKLVVGIAAFLTLIIIFLSLKIFFSMGSLAILEERIQELKGKNPESIEENWTLGDIGFEVVRLQSELKKAGYYKGEITGLYDQETKRAVWYFQEQTHRLGVDGIAGSNTFRKLQKYRSYRVIVPIQSEDTGEDILKRVRRYESNADILKLEALNSSYVYVGNFSELSDAKKKAKELQSYGITAFAVPF
jgi:hypothetical protein